MKFAEIGAQGHEASTALEGTGLTEAQLGLHTTKVSYRQFDRVVRTDLYGPFLTCRRMVRALEQMANHEIGSK